ncbi:MAG: trypsin-like peptidase domain-containing protein [Acidimicrobiia bacterium]|nr:trypsin-like peptidase domain-containing protein [Acidimicrobiia bacterium]
MPYDSDLQATSWNPTSAPSEATDPDLPPLHPRYGGDRPDAQPSRAEEIATEIVPPAMTAGVPYGTGHANRPAPPRPPAPDTKARRGPGRAFILFTALVAAVLGAALAFGAVWIAGGLDDETTATSRDVVETPVVEDTPVVRAEGLDVVSISEKVRPAIVNVKVATGQAQGSGSGVIFDKSGYILTNNHVVADARRIVVQLTDGRELDATVVGTFPDADIAVLEVEGKDLPTAPLGTAATLEIGAPVVAIGNPLGLEGGPTVTTGIVSALGRQVGVGEGDQLYDMIQTDAAILPGSSGGALLDANGKVVGITTAIAVSDAGAEGIGFATPIDVAHNVASQLIESGEVRTALLGVEGTDYIDEKQGNRPGGALITRVVAGGAAETAGIKQGDIVLEVNDTKIDSMPDLKVAIRNFKPGEEITVKLQRGGSTETVKVTLGEA